MTAPAAGRSSPVVEDEMLHRPKSWPTSLTVGHAREVLADDHLHAILVVDGAVLRGVIVEGDVPDDVEDDQPALVHARLDGRTVRVGTTLDEARELLEQSRSRRLAVVDAAGLLVGLLCLKRHGRGFCSDAGVEARRASRASERPA
ncbi:CBS domain-containing protein [Aeromicrobium sp. CnD17-E]|uniref:CBS domain-containing protein n=1 Tax=Aeromicrobium sp. CnD17-E TaxID=2954487 RepID=UPI0020977623|nr:CBS domain-containing protein [Aeromicrobium sp. CnD17-E]MCO7237803.1 CBS domain-containing protein [Aeromicrobium sp. CnD17-E]